MKIWQGSWNEDAGWQPTYDPKAAIGSDLVLAFGGKDTIKSIQNRGQLSGMFPHADIIGCSTAGSILNGQVLDTELVVTAIEFEKTQIKSTSLEIQSADESYDAGAQIAAALPHEDLAHLFILSEGLNINGSALVSGLVNHLPEAVQVTGGLACDPDFDETQVFLNGAPRQNLIAAVGFYGQHIKFGCGSLGGWDPFGPQRIVTRASGNVLYELDGQSALELYKKYLGEYARELPSAGLLFPLSLQSENQSEEVVRTILAVDESEQSLTFAGNIDEGAYVRLMKANFDRLLDGAAGAARISRTSLGRDAAELAILVSCVGRKLVLQQRIEEEVEGARDVLGETTCVTGFYSLGEISPITPYTRCALHNQTMTITTLSER
jgi:hypothetical protein